MRKIKRWICFLLAFALCLSMAGCFDISGYLPSTEETTESGLTTYHITVRTHSGQYLKDVGIRVFADTSLTDIIWYDKTDETGKMTFIADTFDGYVVTLENIPDGYAAAKYYTLTAVDNEIILSIGLQTDVDLNTTILHLGSAMVDMNFAAADGSEYTVSQLLTSKKAVVLYFFDSGSAESLPILEAAWKSCSSEVAVLALNPVDADVSAFAQDRSLPVAACDSGWIGALSLSQFPTMVVVDRYGVISLIHAGHVGDAEVFRDVFTFFSRNDYTPELVTDIDTIIGKELQGTITNPYIADGSADIMASVAPGGMVYYHIYKVRDMQLQLHSANAWVVYEGETYYPENGVITLLINTPDDETPVTLGIGNTGNHAELFVARLSYLEGTESNPHPVDQGQFTAKLEAGDESGVYYMYKAVKPGTLRFSCVEQTEDVQWSYTALNRNSGIRINSEEDVITDELTGEQFMLLEVTANDVVIIHVATKPDEQGEYPAGSFRIQFLYEGENGGGTDEPVKPGKETTYSVTVQDAYGTPLSGVSVIFTDETGAVTVLTDAGGTASYVNALGSVGVTIIPLRGYSVPKSEFTLNASTNNVSVIFNGKMETVPTILGIGNAYPVTEGENFAVMNAGALNFFLFTPMRTGLYRFSAEGTLGFWGTDVNSIVNSISHCFITEDGFTLNVDSEDLGKPHILSITGVPYTTLTITRVGNVAPDPDSYPTQNYTPTHQPQPFTLQAMPWQQLQYADITAAPGTYQLVLDPQTGIYHLNSVDGPAVYVNLGLNAPYFSLARAAASAMVMGTYDENGYIQSKVDFAPCVLAYANCADVATGVYPLTQDLSHILQNYGTYAGWYDGNSANYIFRGSIGVNPANAWMFALCWMA